MDKKDLLTFQKNWLSEIQAKKSKLDNVSKQGSSSSQTLDKNNIEKHNQKTGGHCSIPAFNIVNDYLNNRTDCRFCAKEVTTCKCDNTNRSNLAKEYGSSSTESRKQHNSSRRKHKMCAKDVFTKNNRDIRKNNASKEESLIDLLISDIDEITCIPFFDIELPKEIALCVFKYLSVKDLTNCGLVNSKWKVLAEDDLIWFNLCMALDVERDLDFVADRIGWKGFVKKKVLERRRIQQKWKERFCEVRDLENEKGGIICSVNIYNNTLIAAYLDGCVKLWDLTTGSFGDNLKEKYTSDEDIVTSMCRCTSISKSFCAAGFQNGDLMVWKINGKINGPLIYMQNFSSEIEQIKMFARKPCICIVQSKTFTVIECSTRDVDWKWDIVLTKTMMENILDVQLIEESILKIAVCIRNEVQIHTIHPTITGCITLETLIGATFSCIDHKKQFLVAGINSFGYSVLDGYRVRKYCLQSGKQVANIIGSHVMITCLNYANCYEDYVIIGCSDHKIRIHDFKTESLILTINGINSKITMVQMDKWKVLSGHLDGTVCLWDCINGSMFWQTQQKHPVHLCCFNENLLTFVNLPVDKYPKNSYWYANDLTQHRKYRGSIRVMDFTKDNSSMCIPKEFHAEYDNITGYDYNIELIAPYDNVATFNLPRI